MRVIAIATFCALATVPVQAQKVERIKATGANAAGVCAGSLDMLGQYMSRAETPNAQRIQEVQQGRDFFAEMPRFPTSEITAAANAFVTLMSNRIINAATNEERQAVQRELVTLSRGCLASAKDELRRFRDAAPTGTGTGTGTTQQTIAPTISNEPALVQPSIAQPYSTEPLILDPIVPAQ